MNQKALLEIDYFQIRNLISDFCTTEDGKKSLQERLPFSQEKKITELKTLGMECESYLSLSSKGGGIKSYDSIKPLLPIIKTNGLSLSLEQVKIIADFVVSVKEIKKSVDIAKEKIELPNLADKTESIPDYAETERKIFAVITPDGNIRELPEIVAIRKEIASLNAKIKNIMQKILSDPKNQKILESDVPVLKGGRQVIAVKAGTQNKINGIIYEVSQSGKTCFVEPQDAVLCSNSLVQKENELALVIKKILAELTASLQPSIPFFNAALPIMSELDCAFAAAKWGMQNNCVYTLQEKNHPPLLLKARHPLLGEKAVPVDLRFESGKSVLIITGPNTGGKTVTLKTFALFAMLNQSGFPVPCAEGSVLPVFDNVFADIGDEQSLEQSLSTFSGHMKNIADAVNNATSKSLILLDELGSGTDPQEGSAIAMAVLDELIKRKSFVLVTTHLGVLKNYGYTNECCENASVEFDSNSLSPSYHILMGIPGESHALDIAQKNGLSKNLCDAARKFIATEQADVSALIRGLNKKHLELNKIKKSAEKKENDFIQKRERLDSREENLKKLELNIKKQKMQELDDFLIHSRRQLENLVRSIKEGSEQGEISREKTLGVKNFISTLTQDINRLESKLEREEDFLQEKIQKKNAEEYSRKKSSHKNDFGKNGESREKFSSQKKSALENIEKNVFEEGDFVKSKTSGAEGVIVSREKKDSYTVLFGSVKMTVKASALVPSKKSGNENVPSSPSYSVSDFSTEEKPVFELRLLGFRAEEAVKKLEHQIDLCILNNFLNFSIIHGTGEGVLQQVVKDYLSNCPSVQDFNFASADDGGFGKTYVTLRG